MSMHETKQDNQYKIINRDMMKYIAVFIMFWGHLFAWLTKMRYPDAANLYTLMPMWQQLISHLALFCPPVMFFFVADGFKYTKDRKKYASRLLLFACVTQVTQCIIEQGWHHANVIFTLFFGLLEIMVWESKFKKWQKIIFITLLILADFLIGGEWAVFGDLFILFLHIFRDNSKARLIAYTGVALTWKVSAFIFNLGTMQLCANLMNNFLDFLPVMAAYFCMTMLYNGKKGKHPVFAKWFFYAFYPLHYLVIWAVFLLTS